MGAARDETPPAGRSALRERLSLRRDLPGAGRRRRLGAPLHRHRRHADAPRRNLDRGRPRSARRAAARSRRMAHHGNAHGAEERDADLPAVAITGVEPGRANLVVPALELALQPRLRDLHRHRRRRLRCLAQARRQPGRHHIDRNARLGTHRSEMRAVGITQRVTKRPVCCDLSRNVDNIHNRSIDPSERFSEVPTL